MIRISKQAMDAIKTVKLRMDGNFNLEYYHLFAGMERLKEMSNATTQTELLWFVVQDNVVS